MHGEVRQGCLWALLICVFGWVLVLGLAWLLVGCTATTMKAEAEAEATRAGCLCAGVRCGVLISGSGQAAAGAGVSAALRELTVEGKK